MKRCLFMREDSSIIETFFHVCEEGRYNDGEIGFAKKKIYHGRVIVSALCRSS